MREQPNPENHAAVRLHEHLEEKIRTTPVPPRSEIIDLMVQEALDREQAIDEAKTEKSPKGLKTAQRKPVRSTVVADASDLSQAAKSDMPELEFFENLLAPAPASPDDNKDYGNDDYNDD